MWQGATVARHPHHRPGANAFLQRHEALVDESALFEPVAVVAGTVGGSLAPRKINDDKSARDR